MAELKKAKAVNFEKPADNAYVCSLHFAVESMILHSSARVTLKSSALPKLFGPDLSQRPSSSALENALELPPAKRIRVEQMSKT
jgi:hypothetical protein